MIWSLSKLFAFVAVVALISIGAAFLLESGGAVRIEFAGREYSMAPITFVGGALLLVPVVWALIYLLGWLRAFASFLVGDETALTRYLDRNRERRGYEALADSIVALSTGEPKQAMSNAAKAERFLNRPELTGIVIAQAAERIGDRKQAEQAFRKLLKNDRTKFAGIVGILKLKLQDGETDLALKLAEKAFAINPRQEEVQNVLFRMQAGAQDWSGARKVLDAKRRSKSLPREVLSRRDAVLMFAEAKELIASGDVAAGESAALSANSAAPGLVPAAVLAADIKTRSHERRAAAAIIRKAWTVQPHPDLAAAFAAIEPDELPEARIGRFQQLFGKSPDNPEARMASAELHIANGDFPAARRALAKLSEENPTVRSLAITAAIERGQGAPEHVVRGWLTKAVSAPRGPQWVCDSCQLVHTEWAPVCSNCEGFDSLAWKEVPNAGQVHSSSVGLLPLVVAGKSEPLGTAMSSPDAQ